MIHLSLESYLNVLDRTLTSLPVERRQAEIAEIRSHLQAAIEARREGGESEEGAITSALRQFGTPQSVGHSLRSAFRRGRPSWRTTEMGAVVTAVLASKLVGVVFSLFCLRLPPNPAGFGTAAESTRYLLLTVGASLLLNLVGGILTGIIAPKRAVRGVLIALPLLTVWGWIQSFVVTLLVPGPIRTVPFHDPLTFLASLVFSGTALFVCAAGAWFVTQPAKRFRAVTR